MDHSKIFIVIIRYVVPLETIIAQREEHVKFLDKYYEIGIFHASGPQVPRTGGIIIAKAPSRDALNEILHKDPFYQYKSAEYQVFEFGINKNSDAFATFLES